MSVRKPLTMEEVFMRGKGSYDRATAFRTLKIFHREGLVIECRTRAGMKSYEWTVSDDHHHHIVCLQCEKTRDIVLSEAPLMRQAMSASQGFAKITGHTLEFFGICLSCAR